MSKLFFTFILGFNLQNSSGKVDPPNYNFTLDKLAIYYPDKPFSEIEKLHKERLQLIKDEQEIKLYKVLIQDRRYTFSLFFHTSKGKILDFYTRLPNYFLHDVFHQSLINRYGKQKEYKLTNGVALYQWEVDNLKILYSGTCSMTCFPIFLTVYKMKYPEPELGSFVPYYLQLDGVEVEKKK
ncbi:MAG: hypothetical protein H6620_08500 [Halobacteriovoraceae bacterium]|nr:hypothetical protein [Halobacteriovoraceae bacterium]